MRARVLARLRSAGETECEIVNESNLMSAKLRELMLKHVYHVQRTDGLVRLSKKTRLVKTTKLKVLLESDVNLSHTVFPRGFVDYKLNPRVDLGFVFMSMGEGILYSYFMTS